jgi:hypothetical protein
MKLAKFYGKKGLVVIGDRPLEPGDIVGEPGSNAPVIGCTGVVEYLLMRRDFEEVGGGVVPEGEPMKPLITNESLVSNEKADEFKAFTDNVKAGAPFDGIELNETVEE